MRSESDWSLVALMVYLSVIGLAMLAGLIYMTWVCVQGLATQF